MKKLALLLMTVLFATGIAIGTGGYENLDGTQPFFADGFTNGIGFPYLGVNGMGISNTLSLTGLLDVREGSSIWGGTIGRLYRIGRLAETANRSQTFVIDGVKADGSKNTTPISPQAYYGQYLGDNGSAEETKVYDASWVRLREATLSYTLPKVANWLRNATIYATGRNLWLKTDYLGVDPETSLTGAGSQIGGFDYFNMPSTKSLIFGLRADF